MKKFEEIYQELRKQYTDEEIAESMLIPADLTPSEQQQADEEMRAFRMKLLQMQSEDQRLYADLLRFRYQTEAYLETSDFKESMTFGKRLTEYIHLLKRSKKQLAEELAVHYTRLSRIINEREEPNIELTYRLEYHSGGLIPALIWWKLMIKKQENHIRLDQQTRSKEAAKVKNSLKLAG